LVLVSYGSVMSFMNLKGSAVKINPTGLGQRLAQAITGRNRANVVKRADARVRSLQPITEANLWIGLELLTHCGIAAHVGLPEPGLSDASDEPLGSFLPSGRP
jgi:hypothetical protein